MLTHLDSFCNYLTHEKRYSKHTVISYQVDIKQLVLYVRSQYEITDINAINHLQIRSWIVELMDGGKSAKSINRKISSVRSFFNFLRRADIVSTNPMLKIIAPKIPKRLPAVIREEEMQELLNRNSNENPVGFSQVRDALIVELLYCTGMRRIELINLTDSDIDFNSNIIKVTGKGNKQRMIPIGANLLVLIEEYIELRNEHLELNSYPNLFVTEKGKCLYPKFVYNLVTRVLAKVTTSKKRSPHILRHSFATHLTNNGADINAIKSLLGHSNLAATQIYTHNSIEKLKNVYRNSHPKANR